MDVKVVAEEKYMPKYANDTDACMDIKARICNPNPRQYNFPNYETGLIEQIKETFNSIYIMPGQMELVPTGLQVSVPEGYVMNMYVRSSTGIKKGLTLANGTGIIDSGYRDEIIMALFNNGVNPVEIKDGDRICQFNIMPFPKLNLISVPDNRDFREGDREGGIGSTGEN